MASTFKDIVRPFPGVRQLASWRQRNAFDSSSGFWEKRYARGGTSGPGSYGELAHGKAAFLNSFVQKHKVTSLIEFGCGDGHQLSLAEYPRYIGLDVSKSAIVLCKQRFAADQSKSFFIYDGACFVDQASLFTAELAMSLDVIYHLVEDDVFDAYMTHLFAAGSRFVIIYATNGLINDGAAHVRHRRFSSWIEDRCNNWQLVQTAEGPGDGARRADFYVYERVSP
jgi:hypothetical protein